MKYFIVATTMFLVGMFAGQEAVAQHSTFAQRDSVADEICKSIQRLEKPDSALVYFTAFKHMAKFAMRFPRELQSDEYLYVGLRLNRRCFDFMYYAAKFSSEKADWKIEAEPPKGRAKANYSSSTRRYQKT